MRGGRSRAAHRAALVCGLLTAATVRPSELAAQRQQGEHSHQPPTADSVARPLSSSPQERGRAAWRCAAHERSPAGPAGRAGGMSLAIKAAMKTLDHTPSDGWEARAVSMKA